MSEKNLCTYIWNLKTPGTLLYRPAGNILKNKAHFALTSFQNSCKYYAFLHTTFVGKYQGQWQEGKRHGYGIRTSAPFGLASHYRRKDVHASLNSLRSSDIGEADKGRSEEIRGGFVLTAKSDKLPTRRNSLSEKTKKGFLSVKIVILKAM